MSDSSISRIRAQDLIATTTIEDRLVPQRSTLSGFATEALAKPGVALARLEPWSRLVVRTHNTAYHITVLEPCESRVLVQGGRYFAEATEAVLFGSSFGGNLLKVRWIGCGMRMEISANDRKIVTSPVRSVEVLESDDLPGPF